MHSVPFFLSFKLISFYLAWRDSKRQCARIVFTVKISLQPHRPHSWVNLWDNVLKEYFTDEKKKKNLQKNASTEF